MEALQALVARDDSAIACAKLCFVRFVVDRIPTAVLEECIKAIRQKGVTRKWILLELYQDLPLQIPTKELSNVESYRGLEEVVPDLETPSEDLTSFMVPDLETPSDDPFSSGEYSYRTWGVFLPLPGAELWYHKRGNLILVWDVQELFSTVLPEQTQLVSILVVSVMIALRWLEANARTKKQETTIPTSNKLSTVKFSKN